MSDTPKDRALMIFWEINSGNLSEGCVRAIREYHKGVTNLEQFGRIVGPVNAGKWDRDLRVIQDVIEVMEQGAG